MRFEFELNFFCIKLPPQNIQNSIPSKNGSFTIKQTQEYEDFNDCQRE